MVVRSRVAAPRRTLRGRRGDDVLRRDRPAARRTACRRVTGAIAEAVARVKRAPPRAPAVKREGVAIWAAARRTRVADGSTVVTASGITRRAAARRTPRARALDGSTAVTARGITRRAAAHTRVERAVSVRISATCARTTRTSGRTG